MRSVVLDCSHDQSLRSMTWTRLREEEFISAGKAFLSVLAVAEGDDLDFVQSKLLPHKLSFERYPYPTRDSSQAAHADRSSYLVAVNPRAYANTSQRSNSEAEPSDDGFMQYTAGGDYHAADDRARADAEVLVCRDLDDTETLTESCNPLNTRPSVYVRSSETPTGRTTAGVSFMAQTHVLKHGNEVFYEHSFRADCADDFRSSSSLDTTTSSSDRNTATVSAHHEPHEHRRSDGPSFLRTSGIARQHNLAIPTCEVVLPNANNMKCLFIIPMDRHSLPACVFSAGTSPSPSYSSLTPQAERELKWPEGAPQTPYARCVQQLDVLHPNVQKHISSIIELGDSLLQEDIMTFVKSFCCKWSQTNLCYRSTPNYIAGEGSTIDNLVS
ncbi:hypothetical protein PMIN04_012884 [Paraphaeosphaeria minitans]